MYRPDVLRDIPSGYTVRIYRPDNRPNIRPDNPSEYPPEYPPVVGAGFSRSRPTTVGSVCTETCRYRGTRPAKAGAYNGRLSGRVIRTVIRAGYPDGISERYMRQYIPGGTYRQYIRCAVRKVAHAPPRIRPNKRIIKTTLAMIE
jgi:hypothetical protein